MLPFLLFKLSIKLSDISAVFTKLLLRQEVNFSQFPFSFLLHIFRREVEDDLDSGYDTSSCSESQLQAYSGPTQCGALSDTNGPFAACHQAVPAMNYVK